MAEPKIKTLQQLEKANEDNRVEGENWVIPGDASPNGANPYRQTLSASDTYDEIPHESVQEPHKKMPYALRIALVLFLIDICLFIAASSSQSYEFVSMISDLTTWIGLPAALLFGIGLMNVALRQFDAKNASRGTRPNPFVKFLIGFSVLVSTGFVGLFIAFLIMATTSEKACKLSSSKCY